MVKGFKKCEHGHYYSENLNQCPYCSAKDVGGDPYATRPAFGADDPFEMKSPKGHQRKGYDQPDKTTPDPNATMSGSPDPVTDISGSTRIIPGGEPGPEPARDVRKLVGWLVSYRYSSAFTSMMHWRCKSPFRRHRRGGTSCPRDGAGVPCRALYGAP